MFEINNQLIIIRLLLSFLIGAIIGYTRQRAGQSAGMRTHIVVSLGATIIALVGIEIASETLAWAIAHPDNAQLVNVDVTRLAGQVITGVSFLGAGTIVLNQGKRSVSGLTTAATIWTVAGLGISVGYGFYTISLIGAILLFITLVALRHINRTRTFLLEIHFDNQRAKMKDLFKVLENFNLEVKDIQFKVGEEFAYVFELEGASTGIDVPDLTTSIFSDVNSVTYINMI